MNNMGKKKKIGLNKIDLFMMEARSQGLTYGQLQVKETCEMIRQRDRMNGRRKRFG